MRDHFQMLAAEAKRKLQSPGEPTESAPQGPDELARLRNHCKGLEELVSTYGLLINELSIENEALRAQLGAQPAPTVTLISRGRVPRR